MYKSLGYVVYRRIIDYYSGEKEEDAYGRLLYRLFLFKDFAGCFEKLSSTYFTMICAKYGNLDNTFMMAQ